MCSPHRCGPPACRARHDGRPRRARRPQETDPSDGSGYVRFEHYLKGTDLPIFQAVSSASFTKTGELYMTQPGFRAGLDKIAKRAAITSDDAKKRVDDERRRSCPNEPKAPTADLVLGVRGVPTLPPLLVWQAQIGAMRDGSRCQKEEIYIDAATGAVAADYGEARPLGRRPGARPNRGKVGAPTHVGV